jgi:predicted nuclease with TOPRIM domain
MPASDPPPPDAMIDLDQPATRRDLKEMGDRIGIRFQQVDTRFEQIDVRFEQIDARFKQVDARFEQIDARFDQIDDKFRKVDDNFQELRNHFDVVVETFKTEFRNLFDFVHATTRSLGARLDRLESNHGARLLALETRMTAFEKRRK